MDNKYKYHSAKRDETAWIEHPSGGEFGDLMDIAEELNRLQSEEPQYVYELADTTDEEIYFPYGLFATAEDALNSVRHANEPPTDNPEEHVRFEIRKRVFGKFHCWSTGKTVITIEWVEKWKEDCEESYWSIKISYKGEK